MKVGDRVRHIELPNGASLGEGIVLQVGNYKVKYEVVLVEFYEYNGKLSTRWMRPETLEVVQHSPWRIGNWLFSHFIFLPFIWVMDKLGIRP